MRRSNGHETSSRFHQHDAQASGSRQRHSLARRASVTRFLAVLVVCSATAQAAEVHSNGKGGGPWSDPASWRTKAVPTPTDDAVISRGDVIVFDRNDDGQISCQQLFIDPRGSLVFKTGNGEQVFCAGGPIEAFGTIKLDATRAAADFLELRMVADKPDQRVLRLLKGGALLIAGRDNLPDGRRNAAITSKPPNADKVEPKLDPVGEVDAVAGSTIDARTSSISTSRERRSTTPEPSRTSGSTLSRTTSPAAATSP